MVATPISASARYIPPGTTQYYWVTSIANKAAPTRPELDAGTDLSGEISAVAGFATTSNQVDTPDLKSRFTSKIPGLIDAGDSSITMYASSDSTDARQLMQRDDTGFIVIFGEGDVAGNLMDVYPVKVSSQAKQRGAADPSTIQFQFTITSEPAENVTVP